MNELTEKYLARMLEGAENGLKQIDGALEQNQMQREAMLDQREEMATALVELKELLGLEDEVEPPKEAKLELVEDKVEEPLT